MKGGKEFMADNPKKELLGTTMVAALVALAVLAGGLFLTEFVPIGRYFSRGDSRVMHRCETLRTAQRIQNTRLIKALNAEMREIALGEQAAELRDMARTIIRSDLEKLAHDVRAHEEYGAIGTPNGKHMLKYAVDRWQNVLLIEFAVQGFGPDEGSDKALDAIKPYLDRIEEVDKLAPLDCSDPEAFLRWERSQ